MFGTRCATPRPLLLAALASLALHFAAGSAVAQTLIEIVPDAYDARGSCIPFGDNQAWGFSGFVYQSLPAFELLPGDLLYFDLRALNEVDVRKNIYLAVDDPGAAGLQAAGWTQVVSQAQLPLNPRGNLVVGDYELTFTVEAPFSFAGGTLIVGMDADNTVPPVEVDRCDNPNVVTTTRGTDTSGLFLRRFYGRASQTTERLDSGRADAFAIGGMIIELLARPPVADAGPDQSVDEGELVTLDGSGSSSLNGPLTYLWTQLAGPPVDLMNAATAMPSFMAPYVGANQTLTFELRVDDGMFLSDPATVNVTIVQVNSPPEPDAGNDVTVRAGAVARLDGSQSFDPDGDPVTYTWTQVSGTPVTLVPGPDVAQPTFTAPGTVAETLIFKLAVTDGFEASSPSAGVDTTQPDTVACEIVLNGGPVADAGPDQTRDEGARVTLDGTASTDPDGDGLAFLWTQVSGTLVALDDPTSPTPAFDAPMVATGGEELVFELTVTDDDPVYPLMSAPDQVGVYVMHTSDPPACELAVAEPAVLWPPDHRLVPVRLTGVADPGQPDLQVEITGVKQDEPTMSRDRGDTSPDAVMQTPDTVLLRAERIRRGDGRVYRIAFTATNGRDSCNGTTSVTVPRRRDGSVTAGDGWHDSMLESTPGDTKAERRARKRAERMAERARRLAERKARKAERAAEKIREKAEEALERYEKAREKAEEKARDDAEKARERAEKNRSRWEHVREKLRDKLERLLAKLRDDD